MSKAPEHSFIAAIAEAVAERLSGELSRPMIELDDLGVVPMRVYTAKEAAELLGSHVSSIRQIPEEELPKHRRAGKGIGYLGINILLFQNRLPPVEIAGALMAYRAALMKGLAPPPRTGSDRYTKVQ